jgi:hypothetical protein
MYSLPIALILVRGAAKKRAAHYPVPPSCLTSIGPLALRTRKAVAGGLRHLADVVAPRPVRHPPVLSGACRGQADATATASADRGSGTGIGHRKWLKKERGDHPGPCGQLPTAEPPGRGGRSSPATPPNLRNPLQRRAMVPRLQPALHPRRPRRPVPPLLVEPVAISDLIDTLTTSNIR